MFTLWSSIEKAINKLKYNKKNGLSVFKSVFFSFGIIIALPKKNKTIITFSYFKQKKGGG
jgi:hypothetical protein